MKIDKHEAKFEHLKVPVLLNWKRCYVNTDDGGNPLNLHVRPSKGPYQAKRDPSSRSRSTPPKRSAPSHAGRNNSGMSRQGKLSAV